MKILRSLLLYSYCMFGILHSESGALKKTGFYGISITSKPFFKFWKHGGAVKEICKMTQQKEADIRGYIQNDLPIFYTSDLQLANKLKNALSKFEYKLSIKEMKFTTNTGKE